jgi:hypothetical protein
VGGGELSLGCGIVAALADVLRSSRILELAGHRAGCAAILAGLRTRTAMQKAADAYVRAARGSGAAGDGDGCDADGDSDMQCEGVLVSGGGLKIASLRAGWRAAAKAQNQSTWAEAEIALHTKQYAQANGRRPAAPSNHSAAFLEGVAAEPKLRTLLGFQAPDPQQICDNLASAHPGYTTGHMVRTGQEAAGLAPGPAEPGERFDMSDEQRDKKDYLGFTTAAEFAKLLARAAGGQGAWLRCSGHGNCRCCAVRRVVRYASAASLECLVCEMAGLVKELAGTKGADRGLQLESAFFRLWAQVRGSERTLHNSQSCTTHEPRAAAQEPPLALASSLGATAASGVWESPAACADRAARENALGCDGFAVSTLACPQAVQNRMLADAENMDWAVAEEIRRERGRLIAKAPASIAAEVTRILNGYYGGADVAQGADLYISVIASFKKVSQEPALRQNPHVTTRRAAVPRCAPQGSRLQAVHVDGRESGIGQISAAPVMLQTPTLADGGTCSGGVTTVPVGGYAYFGAAFPHGGCPYSLQGVPEGCDRFVRIGLRSRRHISRAVNRWELAVGWELAVVVSCSWLRIKR